MDIAGPVDFFKVGSKEKTTYCPIQFLISVGLKQIPEMDKLEAPLFKPLTILIDPKSL